MPSTFSGTRFSGTSFSGTREPAGLAGLADPVTRPGPDVGAEAGALETGTDAEPETGRDAGAVEIGMEAEPETAVPETGREAGALEIGMDAEPETAAPETGRGAGALEIGMEADPEMAAPETGRDAGAPETGAEAAVPETGRDAGAAETGTDAEPEALGVAVLLNQSSSFAGSEPDTGSRPAAPLTGAADGDDEAQSAPGEGGGGGAYPSWSSLAADPAAVGFVSSLLGVVCRSSIRPPDRRVPLARTPGAALNRAISVLVSTPGINPITPSTAY